jgi:methylmalonyl-CoA carboxyltransferase 12S subunit
MAKVTTSDLAALLEEIRNQLAELTGRVAQLEGERAAPPPTAKAAAPPEPVPAAAPAAVPEITEEELLAISAAIAAYLGVRVRIRQIRLIGSHAWAQEGRVSIQASHRLYS